MTIRILRCLQQSPDALAANRVATQLNVNSSTCFNILKTLEAEGIVECNPETKRFRLGLGIVELASSATEHLGHKHLIRPVLEKLSRQFGIAATLWVPRDQKRIVLVEVVDSNVPLKIGMPIGRRLPMLAGALGKCLAFDLKVSRKVLNQMFDEVRSQVPLSFEAFLEQSRIGATKGYWVDEGSFYAGVTVIASAVRDAANEPIFGLSMIGLSTQLEPHQIHIIGSEIKSAVRLLERAVRAFPGSWSEKRSPA